MNRQQGEQCERTMHFLESNQVHKKWKSVFRGNSLLDQHLNDRIVAIDKEVQVSGQACVPDRNKILFPLSRCSPRDVKVVIVGHEPLKEPSLSTGLAFSMPRRTFVDKNVRVGRTYYEQGTGRSLAIVHTALVGAGYLEPGSTYGGCHEVWADRGVLLLNASLTYEKDNWPTNNWDSFVQELLLEVVKQKQQKRVFFQFWGTKAGNVGVWLSKMLKSMDYLVETVTYKDCGEEMRDGPQNSPIVLYIGHHPTYPRENNRFLEQAVNQFKEIKTCYPDLFNLPKLELEELGSDQKQEDREVKVEVCEEEVIKDETEEEQPEVNIQEKSGRKEAERIKMEKETRKEEIKENIPVEGGWERGMEENVTKRRKMNSDEQKTKKVEKRQK